MSAEQEPLQIENPYFMASAMKASGAWSLRRRLAAALRRASELVVGRDVPAEQLLAAADEVEAASLRLEGAPVRLGPWNGGPPEGSDPHEPFDQSPMVGGCNPLAPPLTLRQDGNMIRGAVTFSAPYEGAPGCAHGGFVAAAFDEALGFAQCLTGSPGMTAELMVRYQRPTPLGKLLTMEASVVSVDGRKIRTEGRMLCEGQVTAVAEGLFISMGPESFRKVLEQVGHTASD